ncbi:hypothetical protein D9615_008209 [Tricholomella constricta]|uniref:GAG-pre-integrase domain-containing protein n=1 Tax=Tricholomella constricta TaxID=117010 RepID=A0A8H5H399_9AGAR|nr:hypothetical protein D9615_008209 [Tricholomella constricta]
MSSTANGGNSIPSFPDDEKFDGSNFVSFKIRILIAARARGALGYLFGATKRPEGKEEEVDELSQPEILAPTSWTSKIPSAEEWDMRDAWALALIAFNTKNPIGLGIKLNGTGADAWESLCETYGEISDFAAADAERILRTTLLTEGADLLLHITDLRTKWNAATEKGAPILDKEFRTIMLASLPASWNVLVSTLYSCKTSAETISHLTLHWDRLKSQNSAGTATTAMQVTTTKPKPKLVCTNTENCGRTGHTIETAIGRGEAKKVNSPQTFTTANVVDTSEATYALLADGAPEEIYSPATTDAAKDEKHSPDTTAFITTHPIHTFADSGASDHCFVDRAAFSEYEAFTTPHTGQAANKGGTFTILGRGTVKFTVKVEGKISHLLFKSALHTPSLAANLVSIARFDAAGYSITFSSGRANFTDPQGRVFMVGTGTNGLYKLEITHVAGVQPTHAMVARSQSTAVEMDVWHRRLGHAGIAKIREMASKDLVDGLNIKRGTVAEGICSSCVYGKHAARPYDGVVVPEKDLNHRAHFDIWGPASTASLGGALMQTPP